MKLNKETKKQLLDLWSQKKIALEGNILKIIDADGDDEFQKYITNAIQKDNTNRRKRLDVTRQVQSQNIELTKWKEENEQIQYELKESLEKTEKSMIEVKQAMEDTQRAKEEAELAKEEALLSKEEADFAREQAENAKKIAQEDLDILQKKTQFELMSIIIKVALCVILGVGIVTTIVYLFALFNGADVSVIGATWSNIIGILLTNSFSIVGTIMGVKYATEKSESK